MTSRLFCDGHQGVPDHGSHSRMGEVISSPGQVKDVAYVKELLFKSISRFPFTHTLVQKWNHGSCIHGRLPHQWPSPYGKWFLATATEVNIL